MTAEQNPAFANSPDWIQAQEAATLTGYSKRYLWKLARQRRIEAHKLGHNWLFQRDAVMNWTEDMRERGTKKHRPLTMQPREQ